jgi:hypothetical protein
MTRQLTTIALLLAMLVAILVLKSRCGGAVESLFKVLDAPLVSDGGSGD